jgi:hypothetical protein
MTEAYVRLAHVRLLMGRAADADATLKKRPPSVDLSVSFYAAMVEGKTLEALQRLDDAAAAYRRGHDLFPDAPSVNIALSALEQRRGDPSRATAFAQRAVVPPTGLRSAIDPLEAYKYGRGRSVYAAWEALLSALEVSR